MVFRSTELIALLCFLGLVCGGCGGKTQPGSPADVTKDAVEADTKTGDGTCIPSCEGKECGSDDCGGSCGSCPEGKSCLAGSCEAGSCSPGEPCDDSDPCTMDDDCVEGVCTGTP